MGKTSKSNQAKECFACSHRYTMVFNCNEVSSRGLCKPCRRLVLVQQLEEMNRAEWKEVGGSGIDGEIGVLLEKIAEKKKRGFVSKEKELNVYRKADSDSEDSELSSSSSSSDGDVDGFVPGEDEGVLYSREDDGWRVKKKRGSVKVKRVGKSMLRERAEVRVRERADEGKVEGKKSYADAVSSRGGGSGREPSRGSGGGSGREPSRGGSSGGIKSEIVRKGVGKGVVKKGESVVKGSKKGGVVRKVVVGGEERKGGQERG